jgi:hypothetical protein
MRFTPRRAKRQIAGLVIPFMPLRGPCSDAWSLTLDLLKKLKSLEKHVIKKTIISYYNYMYLLSLLSLEKK